MGLKLHLHANFPHDIEKPNAALGYLKSFLSEEPLEVTNTYWYLVPRKVVEMILSAVAHFQSKHIPGSYVSSLFTAYMARFFYEKKEQPHLQPTIVGSIFSSFTSQEKVENAARVFKNFVDYTIETEKMADADVAGFTVKMYQWIINNYIWSQLKDENPNIILVVGGLDTPAEAATFMKTFKNVDYAVWGEGEIPLRELVRHLDDKPSLHEVPRLIYRENGDIYITSASEEAAPYPFADHTDYFNRLETFDLALSPRIPVFSTRFCRWNRCKFCNLHKGGIYYERPVHDIVGEIEYQSKKYGTDKFIFSDSSIGRKTSKELEALLKALLTSAYERRIPYDILAEMSPLGLKREYIEMMSKIRIGVQIGFEALTDTLLKGMDKMHRFAENIQTLKHGNDYNMVFGGLNILRNLPGECDKDVVESMENLKFLRFLLKQYNLFPSELTLYKRAVYYQEIPPQEREKRWEANFLYTEIKQLDLIKEEDKWDFFGFKANSLRHHMLWNQFTDLLEAFQSNDISYSWLEFPDGSSLIEEDNSVSGSHDYLLDEVETGILKFCDSITAMHQLKKEFPHVQIEEIILQLRKEHLLYVDERERLISVLSTKSIKKIHEIGS